jgi:hypothetical protein
MTPVAAAIEGDAVKGARGPGPNKPRAPIAQFTAQYVIP